MHRSEEEEYLISQEEPERGPLFQAIAALIFLGFIIATPAIIDKLGK